MVQPPKWTVTQLERERQRARAAYRRKRVDEPAEMYAKSYSQAEEAVRELLARSGDLLDLGSVLEDLVGQPTLRRALRYTTGPPISEDDLKTVAGVELTKRYLEENPGAYDAIHELISATVDPLRFCWVSEHRSPSPAERDRAVAATATAAASQDVMAQRRNAARQLEAQVGEILTGAGFAEVKKREVKTAIDWPSPGEFCGEHKVAGRQADKIVTLFDSRYMPAECKVSGSAINSIKRLTNDTIAKFTHWTTAFGRDQTVPVAVLEGVFDLERLTAAQDAGATIFWSHNLDALRRFVRSAT